MSATQPAIIDTNVVVAALLSGRDDSPVVRLLRGMIDGAFAFVISDALLAEYRKVLARKKIMAAHGLSGAQVEELLAAIARHAIVLEPVATTLRAPDPGDRHLWELLAAHADVILVSGDKRLFSSRDFPNRLFAPDDFLRRTEHDRS